MIAALFMVGLASGAGFWVVPQTQARVELARFAHCATGGITFLSDRLLASAPQSSEERALMQRLATERSACLGHQIEAGSQLRGQPMWFRGAFFNAVYKRRFATSQALPSDGAVPRVASDSLDAAATEELNYLYAVAGCAIRIKPAAARALALTDVETPEEGAALNAFVPSISACMPSGTQLPLSRPLLRAVVVEVLYDWSVASAPITSPR